MSLSSESEVKAATACKAYLTGRSRGSALVRAPGRRLAEGLVTHIERSPVDPEVALGQWTGYVAALRGAGWEALELPPAEDCPDAVFVEDTMVLHRGTAVIARPGAESRRAETEGAEAAIARLGYRVARIEEPGTLDGGDVLDAGDRLYVGTGGRTSSEGARQFEALVGTPVVEIPIAGVLHLKTTVTALPDGTFAGFAPLVPDPGVFPGLRAVPEPSGANVALLGGSTVLVAADCPRSAELYSGLGFEPIVVDISELQKLEAGVTCLSVLAYDLR
jgi:dimethylargininase